MLDCRSRRATISRCPVAAGRGTRGIALQKTGKILLASLAIMLASSAPANAQQPIREFPVDRSVVDVDNEFNRRDPFYKQRAGAFYDYTYVAPSAEALIRIAQIRPEQMPAGRGPSRFRPPRS